MINFEDWFKEEWRSVPSFEGKYEVSNLGRVRRLDHTTKMMCHGSLFDRKSKAGMCYVKEDGRAGYLIVSIKRNIFYVHRLVAMVFIPNPNKKPYVNHIDNDPKNNHVSNLEWCTQSENLKHAGKQGRLSFTNNKLTVEQVYEIRRSDKSISSLRLCNQFNISSSIVRKIRQGKLWAAH